MSKKAIFLAIFLLLSTVLGGWFSFRSQRGTWNVLKQPVSSSEQQMLPTEEQQKAQVIDSDADFSKYNETLPEQKITGVQDLEGPYKKVTVSDGEVTLSFEVPDHWLTELRNSGEVQMNEEELREFLGTKWDGDIHEGYSCKEVPFIDCLGSDNCSKGVSGTQRLCGKIYSDYADMDWDTLKSMSYQDMRKQIEAKSEFSPGFPNATVTSDNKIWYTDIGWDQVNFYILDRTADSEYIKSVTSFCNTTECLKERYLKYTMDVEKKAERDEHGDVVVDKGHMHGFSQMMNLTDNKVLRIWKEAYVPGEFEDGTKHLIDTFTLE